MIKKLMARLGFIHHTDVTTLTRDLRDAVLRSAQEQRRMQRFADRLTDQHIAMHRQLVETEQGLANAEEEVKHLKAHLWSKYGAKSPVTQTVTGGSPRVTGATPNLLITDELS